MDYLLSISLQFRFCNSVLWFAVTTVSTLYLIIFPIYALPLMQLDVSDSGLMTSYRGSGGSIIGESIKGKAPFEGGVFPVF